MTFDIWVLNDAEDLEEWETGLQSWKAQCDVAGNSLEPRAAKPQPGTKPAGLGVAGVGRTKESLSRHATSSDLTLEAVGEPLGLYSRGRQGQMRFLTILV